MNSEFTIKLKKLRFHSRIGVLTHEQEIGNEFEVNLEFRFPGNTFISEDLTSTINYAEVYCLVKNIMDEEWQLLESVTEKIAEQLRKKWEKITGGKIEIIKIAPPIPGIIGSCGVEYEF